MFCLLDFIGSLFGVEDAVEVGEAMAGGVLAADRGVDVDTRGVTSVPWDCSAEDSPPLSGLCILRSLDEFIEVMPSTSVVEAEEGDKLNSRGEEGFAMKRLGDW